MQTYQRWKDFLCSTSRNWKATMSAGITCSQDLAKVLCWLFVRLGIIFTQQWILLLLQGHIYMCKIISSLELQPWHSHKQLTKHLHTLEGNLEEGEMIRMIWAIAEEQNAQLYDCDWRKSMIYISTLTSQTTTQKKPLKLRSTTLMEPCSWSHHTQSPWLGSMSVELKPLPLGFVDTMSFWKWAVYLFAPLFTLGGPPSRWDYFSARGLFRLL